MTRDELLTEYVKQLVLIQSSNPNRVLDDQIVYEKLRLLEWMVDRILSMFPDDAKTDNYTGVTTDDIVSSQSHD